MPNTTGLPCYSLLLFTHIQLLRYDWWIRKHCKTINVNNNFNNNAFEGNNLALGNFIKHNLRILEGKNVILFNIMFSIDQGHWVRTLCGVAPIPRDNHVVSKQVFVFCLLPFYHTRLLCRYHKSHLLQMTSMKVNSVLIFFRFFYS